MTTVPESTTDWVPSPVPASRHRRRAGRRSRGYQLAVLAVMAVWLAVVLVSPHIHVGPGLHDVALFGHLAALLVGFGAVLTVEWFGLLWLLRRRPLTAVVQVANGAHLPIWLGLVGLGVTGVLLAPAQLSGLTMVKLLAVLLVALNGIQVRRVQQQLVEHAPEVPRALLARSAATAMLSQAAWWTAIIIGFLNTRG